VSFTWWRYKRRFTTGRHRITVVTRSRSDGVASELSIDDVPFAWDSTPLFGPEAVRNHSLGATLPDGRRLEVDAGYISPWSVGIAARLDGVLIHESHPGRTIAYPATYRETAAHSQARTMDEAMRESMAQGPGGLAAQGYDPGQLARNKVPIMVDIALGLLFFVVAKLTDLSTAALVGAGAGLALVVLQRFVKADLLGGLAMFGVVMLLISAGLALAFDDDAAVKLRSTIVGTISAVLFLGDGLLGGNRLGKALTRYLPYSDIDPARLSLGMGMLGLLMAGLNYAVARFASTDVWLFYTTFVDFFLVMLLILVVFSFARGRLLPPRPRAGGS
jgi:intracellular septation protein A